jgi:hypothetical protein
MSLGFLDSLQGVLKIEWSFTPLNEHLVKIFKVGILHCNQVVCEGCKWATTRCGRGRY